MSPSIQDKVILVTGANRGIGKTFVESFLSHGAKKVYATARQPDSLTPLVEQYGDRVVPLALDLANPATITAAAQTATDVDIVINNGGVLTTTHPLDENAVENLAFEIDVNVNGLLRVAQAFAPVLKANGGGALAQLNSVVSLKTFPQFSTYSASKAASYAVTQALREVLKEQGTQVVSIHPGPIATDMGNDAGLSDIAEPPTLVADGLIEALESGGFHVFPDTMAKQIGSAFDHFAKNVVEAEMQEA